jgi:hypothetical protein
LEKQPEEESLVKKLEENCEKPEKGISGFITQFLGLLLAAYRKIVLAVIFQEEKSNETDHHAGVPTRGALVVEDLQSGAP